MTISSSKLTRGQKAERKILKHDFVEAGGTIHSFPECGVTIGLIPNDKEGKGNPRTAQMFISIASNDEMRFKRKVGEFCMLSCWHYGDKGALVPNTDDPKSLANDFATTIDNVTGWSALHDFEGIAANLTE